MKPFFASPKSDWVGIVSSLGCLVHCLALPTLFYVFRLSGEAYPLLHHRLLDYSFAVLASIAVVSSVRKSSSRLVRRVLTSALLFFIGGILLEAYTPYANILLHIGSLGLITGHALNIRQHLHPLATTSGASTSA